MSASGIKDVFGLNHYFDSRIKNARVKMLEKSNNLPVGGRMAVALPAAIASWSLIFASFTVARAVDIVAKPILKSANVLKTTDQNGVSCKYSHASKVRSWIGFLPKLALLAPCLAVNAAFIAAIAPLYIIGKTIALMAGHGKSVHGQMYNDNIIQTVEIQTEQVNTELVS